VSPLRHAAASDASLIGRLDPSRWSAPSGSAVTGGATGWVAGPGGEPQTAGRFANRNRIEVRTPDLRRDAGTIAAWVRLPDSATGSRWIVSRGDNRDAWLTLTADDRGIAWMTRVGRAPHAQAGEGYFSLQSPWPSEDGGTRWVHVAASWEAIDAGTADVAIYLDGQLAEQRAGVPWPRSLPSGPVVIGGNSASSAATPAVELADVVVLRHAADASLVAAMRDGAWQQVRESTAGWRLPLAADRPWRWWDHNDELR